LADEMGTSTKTIQRAVDNLEAAGWIECHVPGGQLEVNFVLKIPSAEWTHNVHSEVGSVTCDVTPSVTRPEWTQNGVQSGHIVSGHKEGTLKNTEGRAPSARPLVTAVSVERVYVGDDDNDEIPY
jgi:hypothetical protein